MTCTDVSINFLIFYILRPQETIIMNRSIKLLIFLGGVYEAQFGDSNYQLLWKNRLGFAKIALEAQVDTFCFIMQIFIFYPLSCYCTYLRKMLI